MYDAKLYVTWWTMMLTFQLNKQILRRVIFALEWMTVLFISWFTIFSLPYISELMKDLSTMKEGIDLRNTTEDTELIIQIKSMLDTGTTQVKVWNAFSMLKIIY